MSPWLLKLHSCLKKYCCLVTPVPLDAATTIKPGDSQAAAILELEPMDREGACLQWRGNYQFCGYSQGAAGGQTSKHRRPQHRLCLHQQGIIPPRLSVASRARAYTGIINSLQHRKWLSKAQTGAPVRSERRLHQGQGWRQAATYDQGIHPGYKLPTA